MNRRRASIRCVQPPGRWGVLSRMRGSAHEFKTLHDGPARSVTLSDLVAAIDSERRHGNLSSAIRLFVLDFYRNQLADVKEGRDDVEGQLAMKVNEPERLRLL